MIGTRQGTHTRNELGQVSGKKKINLHSTTLKHLENITTDNDFTFVKGQV